MAGFVIKAQVKVFVAVPGAPRMSPHGRGVGGLFDSVHEIVFSWENGQWCSIKVALFLVNNNNDVRSNKKQVYVFHRTRFHDRTEMGQTGKG